MSDEDNYTIEDDDEPVAEAAADDAADRNRPLFRTWAPAVLVVLGILAILLAGWCATEQVNGFTEAGPDKSSVFVGALTLPFSIVGALLVVSGVLAVVVRHWNADPVPSEDVPLEASDG